MKTLLINLFCNLAILLVALYLPGWATLLAICLAVFFSGPVILWLWKPEESAKIDDKLKGLAGAAYDGKLGLVALDFFTDIIFLVVLAVLASWPLLFVMLYGHGHGWYSYYKAATSVTRER